MDQVNIERSATGIIRNFGADAASHAEEVALRLGKRDPDAADLWKAIAETIRRLEQTPAPS